jgi:hypothetical protein
MMMDYGCVFFHGTDFDFGLFLLSGGVWMGRVAKPCRLNDNLEKMGFEG